MVALELHPTLPLFPIYIPAPSPHELRCNEMRRYEEEAFVDMDVELGTDECWITYCIAGSYRSNCVVGGSITCLK